MSDANSSFDELLLKELRRQFPGLSDSYLSSHGESLLQELKRRKESLSKDLTVGIPDVITNDLFESKEQSDPKPKRKSKRNPVSTDSEATQPSEQASNGVFRVAALLTAVAEMLQDETVASNVTGALLVLQHGPGQSSLLFTLPSNVLEAIGVLNYYQDKLIEGSLPNPANPNFNPEAE